MSEFIAEAQVLVVPDTSKFRAQLQAQLALATKGVTVDINVVPGKTGAAVTGFARLTQVQNEVKKSLEETTGAFKSQQTAAKNTAASLLGVKSASGKLDAALLGLRTAVGSSAVIGLGAVSLAAIAAGAAIRASLINFAEFEQELATFRVTAGASAEEMQNVSDAAVQLGADVKLPAVSSADAAVAMTELAKAGLSVQDSIDGARGVLELATAAQLSNAEAAQITANALNSFGLAGDQATRVADDFANAANAAQGSIADIGIAFRQASAVARQVGLTLEDTTAILSLFAKNGLQGSDAGTSLRVALIRLVAPTKEAAAEIKKLELNIRDAQGNLRADVFAQFGEATKNLGPAARDAAAALIFGQDAIRAVAIGAREGADGLKLMQFEIDQQGTAAEVSAARTEGLAGQFSALASNAQTLSVNFGHLLSLPLVPFLTGINEAIADLNKLVEAIKGLGNIKIPPIHIPFVFDFPGGDIPGGDIASGIASAITNKLQGAVPIIGPALQLTGVIEDLKTLAVGADKTKEKLAELQAEREKLQNIRLEIAKGGDIALAEKFTARIKALDDEIARLNVTAKGSNFGAVEAEQIKHLETALKLLKGTGSDKAIAEVKRQLDNLRGGLQASGAPIRDFTGGMNELENRARNAADGVDALGKALKGLKGAAFEANSELLKLQNEGAGPQAQILNLQGQRRIQEDIIANIKASGNQSGDATKINAARTEINRIQGQIDSLQAEIVSDQKAAAADAKAKAKDAQDARNEQFEALADTFGGRQQGIEDAIARAGIRGNVAKEQKLNEALIDSLQKELKVLKERFKNIKVAAKVRKAVFDAINRALEDARQDRIRFQQEQQQNIQDNLFKRLDFRVSLAQAQDNTAAEIKARRARMAAISQELARLKNAHKKNTDRWRELRLALAEEVAAIKELEKENEKKKDAQKGAFFSFLQTQQGFAANLLGNLIPGFATKGLVGGSSGGGGGGGGGGPTGGGGGGVIGSFGDALSPEEHGFGPKAGAAASAALSSSRERGVRPVQVDTTNHLLRQILRSLQNLNGRAAAPEARYQKASSGATMDTL